MSGDGEINGEDRSQRIQSRHILLLIGRFFFPFSPGGKSLRQITLAETERGLCLLLTPLIRRRTATGQPQRNLLGVDGVSLFAVSFWSGFFYDTISCPHSKTYIQRDRQASHTPRQTRPCPVLSSPAQLTSGFVSQVEVERQVKRHIQE